MERVIHQQDSGKPKKLHQKKMNVSEILLKRQNSD